MVRICVTLLFAGALLAADCPSGTPHWITQVRVLNAPALTLTDFELKVDGKPRTICQVTRNYSPASIAIVWDTSGSMVIPNSRMEAFALRSAERLLQSPYPGDEWLVVETRDSAVIRVPFTNDLAKVRAGLANAARGKTPLLDGIRLALESLRATKSPLRAVVVLSDGEDNNSQGSLRDLSAIERSAPIPVFVLAFAPAIRVFRGDWLDPAPPRDLLCAWASSTGGYGWQLRCETEVDRAALDLTAMLHSPYLLRFAGAPGRIKVDVRRRPRPNLLYRADPEPSR